ncbi:MAG TPA: DUF5667 domain-containing protein [Patescibacteria group bacterium]|nr:DUF5667 domain-containing protein [Patescibacteria group bacterium]
MEKNLFRELKKLKKEVQPRSEWLILSRDFLLREITDAGSASAKVNVFDYFFASCQLFRERLMQPSVVMISVLATFLVSSLTINAAFYSLPGEPLYRMKLTLEETHVALISGEERKVELKMEFAEKRLAELDKVVAQTNVTPEVKKKNIELAVKEFKNNVSAVSSHLTKISQALNSAPGSVDKTQTVRIAIAVGQKAQDLAKSIDETASELKENDLADSEIVAEAVQSVEETSASAQELAEGVAKEETQGEVEGAATDETGANENQNNSAATSSENGVETTSEIIH